MEDDDLINAVQEFGTKMRLQNLCDRIQRYISQYRGNACANLEDQGWSAGGRCD